MGLETSTESSQIQCAVCHTANQEGGEKAALTVSPPEAKEIDCMGWCAIT